MNIECPAGHRDDGTDDHSQYKFRELQNTKMKLWKNNFGKDKKRA